MLNDLIVSRQSLVSELKATDELIEKALITLAEGAGWVKTDEMTWYIVAFGAGDFLKIELQVESGEFDDYLGYPLYKAVKAGYYTPHEGFREVD